MKLNVQPGPLPIAPPYFDWDDEELEPMDSDEEIDLSDLFEPTKDTPEGN